MSLLFSKEIKEIKREQDVTSAAEMLEIVVEILETNKPKIFETVKQGLLIFKTKEPELYEKIIKGLKEKYPDKF